MTLRVAAVELAQDFGDVEAQIERARDAIAKLDDVDLALLPEAIFTGYVSPDGDFDVARFAEPLEGPTTRAVRAMAKDRGVAIVAPLVERDGDRVFNSAVVVDRGGEIVATYRKRHPWYPEKWASRGEARPPLFRVGDLTLTIAICFDIHFVARDAAAELEAADALLFPSAWVELHEGDDARAALFEDLRRRFDLAIVNANWAPSAPRLAGQGGSRVVLRSGEVRLAEDGAAVATVCR